jgi:hypothetical protein
MPEASRFREARQFLLGRLDLAQRVRQVHPVDELGDDVEHAELRLLRQHAIADQRLMMEARHRLRLLAEHGDDLLVRSQSRQHHLDGDALVRVDVHALEHLAHPPRARKAIDPEDVIEAVADLDALAVGARSEVRECRHGRRPGAVTGWP